MEGAASDDEGTSVGLRPGLEPQGSLRAHEVQSTAGSQHPHSTPWQYCPVWELALWLVGCWPLPTFPRITTAGANICHTLPATDHLSGWYHQPHLPNDRIEVKRDGPKVTYCKEAGL